MYVQQLEFSANYKKYVKYINSNFDAGHEKTRIRAVFLEVKEQLIV